MYGLQDFYYRGSILDSGVWLFLGKLAWYGESVASWTRDTVRLHGWSVVWLWRHGELNTQGLTFRPPSICPLYDCPLYRLAKKCATLGYCLLHYWNSITKYRMYFYYIIGVIKYWLFQIEWLKNNSFGGFMMWALDYDDFLGIECGGTQYPLLRTLNVALIGGIPTTPATTGPPLSVYTV